jgi:hypothetical protein
MLQESRQRRFNHQGEASFQPVASDASKAKWCDPVSFFKAKARRASASFRGMFNHLRAQIDAITLEPMLLECCHNQTLTWCLTRIKGISRIRELPSRVSPHCSERRRARRCAHEHTQETASLKSAPSQHGKAGKFWFYASQTRFALEMRTQHKLCCCRRTRKLPRARVAVDSAFDYEGEDNDEDRSQLIGQWLALSGAVRSRRVGSNSSGLGLTENRSRLRWWAIPSEAFHKSRDQRRRPAAASLKSKAILLARSPENPFELREHKVIIFLHPEPVHAGSLSEHPQTERR